MCDTYSTVQYSMQPASSIVLSKISKECDEFSLIKIPRLKC